MELSPQSRRSVFIALSQVAWADGRLRPSELAALRGAAKQLALLDRDSGVAGLLSLGPSRLPPLEIAGLPLRARALCVAGAAWAALTDEIATPTEDFALAWIIEHSGLDAELAGELCNVAWQIRTLRPDELAWSDEFGVLCDAVDAVLCDHDLPFDLPSQRTPTLPPSPPHFNTVRC
jgi:hypothetical protein